LSAVIQIEPGASKELRIDCTTGKSIQPVRSCSNDAAKFSTLAPNLAYIVCQAVGQSINFGLQSLALAISEIPAWVMFEQN